MMTDPTHAVSHCENNLPWRKLNSKKQKKYYVKVTLVKQCVVHYIS